MVIGNTPLRPPGVRQTVLTSLGMNLLHGAPLDPESDARSSIFRVIYRDVFREPKGNGRTALPVVWATTRGTVRTENQDRFAVLAVPGGLAVAALADGMGGMREGGRAAATAVSAIVSHCMSSRSSDIQRMLVEALSFANAEVFRDLHGDGGAAVVVAAWTPQDRYIAHAGDARGYWIQADGRLKQLTVDDTVQAQLQDMGRAPRADLRHDSSLLQFIGVGKDLEPHINRVPADGRGLILTTDGVHSLPHEVMEWMVMRTGHLQEIAKRLVTASEWNGGDDNGSVIAISFQNGRPAAPEVAEVWVADRHSAFHPFRSTEPTARRRTLLSENAGEKKAAKPKRRQKSKSKAEESASRVPVVEFGEHQPKGTAVANKSPEPTLFPAEGQTGTPEQSSPEQASKVAKVEADNEHTPETQIPDNHGDGG